MDAPCHRRLAVYDQDHLNRGNWSRARRPEGPPETILAPYRGAPPRAGIVVEGDRSGPQRSRAVLGVEANEEGLLAGSRQVVFAILLLFFQDSL